MSNYTLLTFVLHIASLVLDVPFDEEKKRKIENQIVEAMIDGLKKEELDKEEVPKISAFVLQRIDSITNQQQLIDFLRELSAMNRVFTLILIIESGEIQEREEFRKAQQALNLIKQGQIEQAIKAVGKKTTVQ